jgi:hypothetical protein
MNLLKRKVSSARSQSSSNPEIVGQNRFWSDSIHTEPRVHSHAPSIWSHRETKVVFPDFQPMRVLGEPVCIYHFRQNPFFTSLHLRSHVYVVPPLSWQSKRRLISSKRVHQNCFMSKDVCVMPMSSSATSTSSQSVSSMGR